MRNILVHDIKKKDIIYIINKVHPINHEINTIINNHKMEK